MATSCYLFLRKVAVEYKPAAYFFFVGLSTKIVLLLRIEQALRE